MHRVHQLVFSIIIGYLTDEDAINFICTCSHLKKLGDSCGYIKTLKINEDINMDTVVKVCIKHRYTLNHAIINRMSNPLVWLPIYPKKVSLIDCIFTKLKVGIKTNIEEIYVKSNKKRRLSVDINDFPQLKSMTLESPRETVYRVLQTEVPHPKPSLY